MILQTIIAAIVLGILAQLLADRIKIPAILPLLFFGMTFGPSGFALFSPSSLRSGLDAAIHLGVAIILFEGGLSLENRHLVRISSALWQLLSLGVMISMAGTTLLAHFIIGMNWPVAALFGSIMVVTGPTVILPLLRHLIAPRRVRMLLFSEGLIIDPIGAVLAYLALQWITMAGIPFREISLDVIILVLTGTILGFAGGSLAAVILRSRLIGGELSNLTILAILLLCFFAADHQAPQSGILAAMVMGITLANSNFTDLAPLKTFKGQLTTLVISSLFILLSGQLNLQSMIGMSWKGMAVVAGIILLVRPASVFLGIRPSLLTVGERSILSLTAPKGIVAAALGSLAARRINALGVSGGDSLESLVYLTIFISGLFSTIMAIILPKWLGYINDPSRKRTLIIGANCFTDALTNSLFRQKGAMVIIDSVPWRLDTFRKKGIQTVCGDGRDSMTYEMAGIERDSKIIAATSNEELNLMIADLVRQEFGVDHPVVAVQKPPEKHGKRIKSWIDLLGGGNLNIEEWSLKLHEEKARVLELKISTVDIIDEIREMMKEYPDEIRVLILWKENEPDLNSSLERLRDHTDLTCIISDRIPAERIEKITAVKKTARNSEPLKTL